MNRPVVIVDPTSSGIELAPAFKKRGIPAIAITLGAEEWPEFGSKIRASDFIEVISNQPNLLSIVQKYHPLAILPGTEEGIPLAEYLNSQLMPHYLNDLNKSAHRSHKALMQKALENAGIQTLKTIHSASESEVEKWIKKSQFENTALIVKPPASSGSDKVFHIPVKGDWKKAFHRVLNEPLLSGKKSETVVIQEQAIGTEYAIGTVSAHGKHYLTHLMKYNKTSIGERKTIFDHVEFVPYDEKTLGELVEYTKNALDALGVRFGASHTEVMLTEKGPRLIESSPRMIGGPVVEFAREASGSSQADKLVELFVDGDVVTKEYTFQKTVMPVFLKAIKNGTLLNIEIFNNALKLPTFFKKHIWVKNGDKVPQTVDYLTSIGIIALSGDLNSIYSDYEKIRKIEAELLIE